jgi:hypothetical protein
VLKDAATVFADLLWDDNGVGINAYDHDPHAIMPVTRAGAPGANGGRDQAIAAIAAHASNPAGWTAVGDGIEMARADLTAAGAAWDVKAMIVLTDGIETASKTVTDVADSVIDNRVYAIGMGTAEQIMPATLDALTSATGGYLLMTGHLSADETFLLEKYYLQILAGVNNNDVVLDPEGTARIGAVERIPFQITEADVELSAIVLARPANILRMGLEAPDGTTIGFGNASVIGRVAPRSIYMRAGLPLMAAGRPHHAGRWHLLLTIDRKYWQRVASANESGALSIDGVRYSASVTAYSGLRMMASVAPVGTGAGGDPPCTGGADGVRRALPWVGERGSLDPAAGRLRVRPSAHARFGGARRVRSLDRRRDTGNHAFSDRCDRADAERAALHPRSAADRRGLARRRSAEWRPAGCGAARRPGRRERTRRSDRLVRAPLLPVRAGYDRRPNGEAAGRHGCPRRAAPRLPRETVPGEAVPLRRQAREHHHRCVDAQRPAARAGGSRGPAAVERDG